jgi:hypothetical protein
MASINAAKKLFDVIVNKEQNGQVSVDALNTIARSASDMFFNDNYGQPMQSQNGMSRNDVFYQSNKKIGDNLRNLIKLVDIPVNAKGRVTRPSDFIHTSSIRFSYKTKIQDCTDTKKPKYKTQEVEVEEIQDQEIATRLSSELLKPTLEYPIACIYDKYIQVYPANVGTLKFTYLRKPAVPIWAFTTTNGVPLFDAANSVDFDYPDECINELVIRMASVMGINISNNLLLQYTNQMKQQGT